MNASRPRIMHEAPIGVEPAGTRRQTASVGGIDVPADRYWGW